MIIKTSKRKLKTPYNYLAQGNSLSIKRYDITFNITNEGDDAVYIRLED